MEGDVERKKDGGDEEAYIAKSQLVKSVSSIPANIAEGYGGRAAFRADF